MSETSPLLATERDAALGTTRFPFHPEAASTPWWRRLWFQFFDDTSDAANLELKDIWSLPKDLQSREVAEEMQRCFVACDRRLVRTIWRMNRSALIQSAVLALGSTVTSEMYPLLLYRLLSIVVADEHVDMWCVIGQIALLFVVLVAHLLLDNHAFAYAKRVSARIGGGLPVLLLRELIRHGAQRAPSVRDQPRQQKQQLAQLAMLYEDDCRTICYITASFNQGWTSAIELAVNIGIIVFVVEVPWMVLLVDGLLFGFVWAAEQWEGLSITDLWRQKMADRLNAVHECFRGIQNVKLNAWEDKMQQKIEQARQEEVTQLHRLSYMRAVSSTLGSEVSNFAAALTFGWMAHLGRPLTPAGAFTILILFNRFRETSKSFRGIVDMIYRAKDAIGKIETHLSQLQLNETSSKSPVTAAPSQSISAIIVQDVWLSCSGLPHATDVLVANANLTVRRGELVVIHGLAGVGKSLLLSAIRGDIDVLQGHVHVDASLRVAYCSQEPWLQTMSIRDNVLFGSAFDERKYWCVMDACGLLEDLEQLPMGDATQVGPKGINLSGGQKARIALARACYADADLYLLDCPLASVDAVVQSDVFRKCVVELLVHKTIVMVTHNPEIMGSSFVDQVVELRGTHLRSSSTVIGGSSRASSKEWQSRRRAGLGGMPPWRRSSSSRNISVDFGLQLSPLSRELSDQIRRIATSAGPKQGPGGTSVHVSSGMLHAIFSHPDTRRCMVWSLAILLCWAALAAFKDVLTMWWAGGEVSNMSGKTSPALLFAGIVVAMSVASLAASLMHQVGYFRATDRLFHKMTHSLLHATMSFFYVTSVGDILNAYFSEISVMDKLLARFSILFFTSLFSYTMCLFVVWYILGWLGITLAAISFAFLRYTMDVRFTVRLLEIGNILGEDSLALMSELLEGESTLRAFGSQHFERLDQEHCASIDTVVRFKMFTSSFNSFVLLRSSIVSGASLVLVAVVVATRRVSSAELGLLIFYTTRLQHVLISICTGALNSWSFLFSAQNIYDFGKTRIEREEHAVAAISSNSKWPSMGCVVFENVTFGYADTQECVNTIAAPTTPLALRDVSFSVRSGERVGVVGRTGSGKSSLAMALFRMHPLVSGRILVDGVDISRLSLKTVRSSITIIPQTPLFYRCSVRDYLDPFGEYDDGRLWREVKRVGLGGHVRSLSDELWDNGENWSLGERQMLCFARALLRPSRVLVLDEAFSSVDQGREESLLGLLEDSVQPQQQQQQQSPYSNRDDGGGRCERGVASSTVFLITHRVDQILGFDRILVMANGSVVEQGSATSLASDPSSLFYDFLETSLLTM
ncbi:hypothetical protein PINS_up006249 [Pythium insidiosum]|nr:hypothetical protein PINS_up006249 [Pythium insidiosum]